MELQAVEKIQESVAIIQMNGNLHGILEEGQGAGIVPTLAVHKDFEIQNLEHYMPAPTRFRGLFETEQLSSFADYCKNNGDKLASAIYLKPDEPFALAIFDNGSVSNPAHREHRAVIEMQKLADYAEIISLHQKRLSQSEMVDLVEDFGGLMTFLSSDGETLESSKVLTALRNVKISDLTENGEEVQDFSNSRSSMRKVSLNDASNMPKFVDFLTVPYPEFKEQVLRTRLTINTGNELTFKLNIIKLEAHKEMIVEEFQQLLNEKLKDGGKPSEIKSYIGSFR